MIVCDVDRRAGALLDRFLEHVVLAGHRQFQRHGRKLLETRSVHHLDGALHPQCGQHLLVQVVDLLSVPQVGQRHDRFTGRDGAGSFGSG